MFYFHKLIYWGITLRSSLYKNPRKGLVIINTNLKKDRKKERKKEKGATNKNKHKTSRKSQLDKIYGHSAVCFHLLPKGLALLKNNLTH